MTVSPQRSSRQQEIVSCFMSHWHLRARDKLQGLGGDDFPPHGSKSGAFRGGKLLFEGSGAITSRLYLFRDNTRVRMPFVEVKNARL